MATVNIALISLTVALSVPVLAQDAGLATPPQRDSAHVDSTDARSPSARLATLAPKSWGSLAPNFGDAWFGDAGGVRSTLADHGIGGVIMVDAEGFQNLLASPSTTNGHQAYIGQQFTNAETVGLVATYDLGHIGLAQAQFILDFGCFAATDLNLLGRGCRFSELSAYDSFFRGRVELSAGILGNDLQFVDTYVGGNVSAGGASGASAILSAQSGLSWSPGVAPGLDMTYHFNEHWYDKLGVQRSTSPEGLIAEYSHFNELGLRFSEPLAGPLLIDELGFKQLATARALSSFVRVGGLYNWSEYTNFKDYIDFHTRGASSNWNGYLLADQQVSRPDADLPFRGWYGGFTVMVSPADVNVFQRYYELRLYDTGPFASHPFDQLSIVATNSHFSGDARQYYVLQGVHPPQKYTTSLAGTYAYKVGPDSYVDLGLDYTDHPSFIYAPGQGHDLNLVIALFLYL